MYTSIISYLQYYIYDDNIVYNMLINNACGEAPRGHGATHGAGRLLVPRRRRWRYRTRAPAVDLRRSPGRKLLDIILLLFITVQFIYIIYILLWQVLCVVQYSEIDTQCKIVLHTWDFTTYETQVTKLISRVHIRHILTLIIIPVIKLLTKLP